MLEVIHQLLIFLWLTIPTLIGYELSILLGEIKTPKSMGHGAAISASVISASAFNNYINGISPETMLKGCSSKIINNTEYLLRYDVNIVLMELRIKIFLFFTLFCIIILLGYIVTRITNEWQKNYEKEKRDLKKELIKINTFVISNATIIAPSLGFSLLSLEVEPVITFTILLLTWLVILIIAATWRSKLIKKLIEQQ